jgi:hypothetical protein
MGNPTTFTDDSALGLRSAEVPDAQWGTGGDWAGSNAHGLGINHGEGAVSGEPQQFTLLDQDGAARNPAVSGVIGHEGYTDPANWPSSGGAEGKPSDSIRQGTTDADGLGTVTPIANVALTVLATGWVNAI